MHKRVHFKNLPHFEPDTTGQDACSVAYIPDPFL